MSSSSSERLHDCKLAGVVTGTVTGWGPRDAKLILAVTFIFPCLLLVCEASLGPVCRVVLEQR